jgi:hypothetical protein
MSGSIALGIDDDEDEGAAPAPEDGGGSCKALALALARTLAGVKVVAVKMEAALHSGFGADGDDDGAKDNMYEALKQCWAEMHAGGPMLWAVGHFVVDTLSTASAISVVPDTGIPDDDDDTIEDISACHDAISDAWDEVSQLASDCGYGEIADFADQCSDAHDAISDALDGDDEDNGDDTDDNGTASMGDPGPDGGDYGDDGMNEAFGGYAADGVTPTYGEPIREGYIRHGQDPMAQAQDRPKKNFIASPEIKVGARTDEEIAQQQAWMQSGNEDWMPDQEFIAKGMAIGAVKLMPRAARMAGRIGARTDAEVAERQGQLAAEG